MCELVAVTSMFFHQVDYANDGYEGLEKYKLNKYDLILTDISMPKMNGIKLSGELRSIEKDLPILVLSAHSELEYLIQLIDIGVNQFVAKPFNPEELYYKLLKISENLIHKKNFEEHYGNKTDLEIKQETIKIEKIKPKINVEINKNILSHESENAKDFIEKLEEEGLDYLILDEQIDSLIEYSEQFAKHINKIYVDKFDKKTIIEISNIITNIRNIFLLMDSLNNLSFILKQISDFLIELDYDELDKNKKDKIKILEFICDDISRYIDTVFVYKDTVDIYYLEDSLNSSFEQLKMNLSDEKFEEEELDLF